MSLDVEFVAAEAVAALCREFPANITRGIKRESSSATPLSLST